MPLLYLLPFVLLLFVHCNVTVIGVSSSNSRNHTVVIVPSVFKEWDYHVPSWASEREQRMNGYSIFLYQKSNSSGPNFISTNRGTEGGVYLRYIVDHYDNFPDVAVFVHAAPEVHVTSFNWLAMINCIRPDATFINFNTARLCRHSSMWKHRSMYVEQCWRDVLKVVWEYSDLPDGDEKVLQRLSTTKPIHMCAQCCQQFILSRSMVHARPLSTWKKLHYMIGVSPVCHIGDLNYTSLYSTVFKGIVSGKPENANISDDHTFHGKFIQGGTMEHLAHVIFGHQNLVTLPPENKDYCKQFISDDKCPGSPCRAH